MPAEEKGLEAQHFVRACMRVLGVDNQSRFADELELPRSGQANINKWLGGITRPTYPYLMPLLEHLGFLTEDALTLWHARTPEEALRAADAIRARRVEEARAAGSTARAQVSPPARRSSGRTR